MIRKRPALPGTKQRPKGVPRRNPRDKLEATLTTLVRLEQADPNAASMISLLKSWLEDESGYDEETWPELRKSLDQQRRKHGARRLFDG